MNFEVIGEVTNVLPVESGITNKGVEWKSWTFVLKAFDKEQHKIALRLRNERIREFTRDVQIGKQLHVYFEIESRPRNIVGDDGKTKTIWGSVNNVYYLQEYTDSPSNAMRMQAIIHGMANSMEAK